MTGAAHEGPLLICPSVAGAGLLAEALGCDCRVAMPDVASEPAARDAWARRVERWRLDGHPVRHAQVVVAAFDEAVAPIALTATSAEQWRRRLEMPFALCFAALQLAAGCCADGGAIVVLVDAPEPLHVAGRAPSTALAEGLQTAARSLALAEGHRGVRVNTVTTPARTGSGRTGPEVAAAVRTLLGAGAAGLTGQVLHAGRGAAP